MHIVEPDWPALYGAGPTRIPLEHSAYARLSRPFLDFFVRGSGYETSLSVAIANYGGIASRRSTLAIMP